MEIMHYKPMNEGEDMIFIPELWEASRGVAEQYKASKPYNSVTSRIRRIFRGVDQRDVDNLERLILDAYRRKK